jgi:hypothetical protein
MTFEIGMLVKFRELGIGMIIHVENTENGSFFHFNFPEKNFTTFFHRSTLLNAVRSEECFII